MRSQICLYIALMFTAALSARGQQQMQLPVTGALVERLMNSAKVKHVHPRLFFSGADVSQMQQLRNGKDKIFGTGYTAIAREAKERSSKPLLIYYLDAANLRIPSVHQFAVEVPGLVLLWQLDRDTAAAERAALQMDKMASYSDWGQDRHFLDAGIAAFDFAMVYDGLYDYLSAERRKLYKEAVTRNVLRPGLEQLKKKVWWTTANNNWNGICNGGIIMAALAMFEDDPVVMGETVAAAVNALPKYIRSFEPDGQSEEGILYWGYGLMYTTLAMESMHRVLGSSFGLDAEPGFRKTGWFPFYMSGPVTTLNIGDDPLKNKKHGTYFWFSKHYNDTALFVAQVESCLQNKEVSWHDMLFYRPSFGRNRVEPRHVRPDNYVRGIEVMSIRSGWDSSASFIAMHGGRNDANHGHLDAGSFDLQADGVVWANGNMGRDDYTLPGYFTKETYPRYWDNDTVQTIPCRWHFYRLRAEGKNCMVFGPDRRPDQDPKGEAKLVKRSSDSNRKWFIADLQDCYKRQASSYLRGIRMDMSTGVMTIQDDIVLKEAQDSWWQMHTAAEVSITEDGRTAVLTKDGKRLVARIVSPANLKFSVMAADYLPGKRFPLSENTENRGFRKLVIHMPGFSKGTVRVDLYSGDKTSSELEPMINW